MCPNCNDLGWVCENHPNKMWDDSLGLGCQCGAGMACKKCNWGNPPRFIGEVIWSVWDEEN